MTRALLAATAASMLLAGCGEGAGDAPENAAQSNATNMARSAPGGLANAADPTVAGPLGEPVSGDEAKRLMHERHEGMEKIGDAMKLVSLELKRGTPDLAKVRSGAATIARLAPQVSGWYRPGTGPEAGKTSAKPEIWQKPEDFAAKIPPFERAAQAFEAAARGSDLAAIRDAHVNLGKSCKACHDPYRAPDH